MQRKQRGDTIIEVLLAVTLFSVVAVGTMAVMNRGTSTAQRSLEVTLVRHQIDAQAELLRFVHARATGPGALASDKAAWQSLPRASTIVDILNIDSCPASLPTGGFTLYAAGDSVRQATRYRRAETYAQQRADVSEGLQIQLVRVQGGGAYDAYIQACWYSPGLLRPMTTGTIVRVYDAAA